MASYPKALLLFVQVSQEKEELAMEVGPLQDLLAALEVEEEEAVLDSHRQNQ
jgi:hypothetical protein